MMHKTLPIYIIAIVVFSVSSLSWQEGIAAEEPPFDYPDGFYEGRHEEEAAPVYFHFQSPKDARQVEVSSGHSFSLPARASINETEFAFDRLKFYNTLGVPMGLGQAARTMSLWKDDEQLMAKLRGRAPFGERFYPLEPLTGARQSIFELNHRADELLEARKFDELLNLYTKNARGTRAASREDRKTILTAKREDFDSNEYEQGRMVRSLRVQKTRAFMDSQHVVHLENRMVPTWELQFLTETNNGWAFGAKERVAGHLMRFIGPHGYGRPGDPVHIPVQQGWFMYILEALQSDGKPYYITTQMSPNLDAAVSVVLQSFPLRPEDFTIEDLAKAYNEQLQIRYPEMEVLSGETRKIGPREYQVTRCRYAIWFGDCEALRYYTLTKDRAVIIAVMTWDEKTRAQRIEQGEDVIARLAVPD